MGNNRQKWAKVNNSYSTLQIIISAVLEGSIVDLTLFNAFLKDFLNIFKFASIHDFAADDTLSFSAKRFLHFVDTLKSELEIALN